MMIHRITPLLLMAALAGCSSRDADLEDFIKTTRQEPPGAIEPLPEVKPYESFVYDPAGMRSPFIPYSGANANSAVRPVVNRNKEFLEQFPLTELQMTGTMSIKGKYYALVGTKDNLTTQMVQVGNYLGQSEGKITKIEPSMISITETVADGTGGYMERMNTLPLKE